MVCRNFCISQLKINKYWKDFQIRKQRWFFLGTWAHCVRRQIRQMGVGDKILTVLDPPETIIWNTWRQRHRAVMFKTLKFCLRLSQGGYLYIEEKNFSALPAKANEIFCLRQRIKMIFFKKIVGASRRKHKNISQIFSDICCDSHRNYCFFFQNKKTKNTGRVASRRRRFRTRSVP